MGLIKKLFTNCACPQGRMGRAMLKFMNLCHAPLTNWGLKLVDIHFVPSGHFALESHHTEIARLMKGFLKRVLNK